MPITFTNGITITPKQATPIILGGSYEFGTYGKYLSVPGSNDFAMGSADFCVEWFQYQTALTPPSYSRVWEIGGWPNHSLSVSIESGNLLAWVNNGYGWYGNFSVANQVLNQWVHFALVRTGGQTSLYLNGSRVINLGNTNSVTNNYDPLTIGQGSENQWNGYLTNFRFVSNNSVYDANQSTIIVPTQPLTAVNGTKLLLLAQTQTNMLEDFSGTGKIVTNNGSVAWNSLTPF